MDKTLSQIRRTFGKMKIKQLCTQSHTPTNTLHLQKYISRNKTLQLFLKQHMREIKNRFYTHTDGMMLWIPTTGKRIGAIRGERKNTLLYVICVPTKA